ncbi:MAG: flagellar basal body L-ring protein FlgH [Marinosulfonomonas sp.]|nr:flagellar basal body L-ring protein FlgH [Marinosulfonomonas sp.]
MRNLLLLLLLIPACARLDKIDSATRLTTSANGAEHLAMMSPGLPSQADRKDNTDTASLWSGGRQSLLGDRRALRQGDIMTVVIEIDDKAEISNSTTSSRSGSQSMALPSLLGIPQRINPLLPEGASLDSAVSTNSSSEASGDGSVRRKEKLTLRVAATVTSVLPNGVLEIQGTQEVRVNFEVRELLVSGYVRPEDISRQNEITYDKIASARISYGGRGQISNNQRPRYGQRVVDSILPF